MLLMDMGFLGGAGEGTLQKKNMHTPAPIYLSCKVPLMKPLILRSF